MIRCGITSEYSDVGEFPETQWLLHDPSDDGGVDWSLALIPLDVEPIGKGEKGREEGNREEGGRNR